ncbi:MAG: CRISPR-associated helicase Cas3' [Oscillospiraceae bacterium]|nr:CRISPR-associated helicase Cas3' [Oscillospiraceae bacterium]
MGTKEYYAHVREDGKTQTVEEHLRGTAELCGSFADAFQSREQGTLIGNAHDIGKFSAAFQKRLFDQAPRVDHSTAGAYECFKRRQPYAAFCIAGHHSGLPDGGSRTDVADQPTLFGRIKRAEKRMLPDYSDWTKEIVLPDAAVRKDLTGGLLGEDFYTRMLFSCLTDADFLDTERFMTGGKAERDAGETIHVLAEKLDAFVEKWFSPKNEINRQRCAILSHCIERGNSCLLQPGLFSLTVPTGGGKTVASLAFALHHAKTHGKTRVVYVIPYTSIIEQTADVFRGILGERNVLEHHSGVLYDTEDEATTENLAMLRATENWDKPIVVTTAVQFFESIYSNRSSQCRKLHNLADSVIVFDEAQMLPLAHLRPCVSAIAQLVANFGASAILCTATQPSLHSLFREFCPDLTITELCPAGVYDPAQFRRVEFERIGLISWQSIAERMQDAAQSLCIVNTRKSAKHLYALLREQEGTYHLSTMMVPAHRRNVLSEIRERLRNGLPCRVVSTSLIEAGVDVDFPLVLREIAGVDSILQAAGRCNREGKRAAANSIVGIFRSDTPVPPLFERNADIGRAALMQFEDIASDEAISYYFKELLLLTGDEAQDQNQILPDIRSGTFPFASIAKRFRLIDSDTKTVYIPWGKGEELIERIQRGERSRKLFREAAQYAVSLFSRHFQELYDAGDISQIDDQSGLWYLTNKERYSDADGISIEADPGRALFV